MRESWLQAISLQKGGVAILALIALVSCNSQRDAQGHAQESVEPERSTAPPARYEHKMDLATLEKFKMNLRKVHLGDSPENVIKLVGIPDRDQVTTPKTYEETWKKRELEFTVRSAHSDGLNPKLDQKIDLFFEVDQSDGNRGRLVVFLSNVGGIPSKCNSKYQFICDEPF